MEERKEEDLVWPPRAEDLRRLYLEERLSAARIAERYGLKYASPKTAESTVLYHLKKNGISRRDKAEYIRKVTEVMVDSWVKRYEAGESLKQIAGNEFSPVTVFLHLRKRRVQLRDKVEAQIQAVSIHQKRSFSGDRLEGAYILGFVRGDAWVVTHVRAVRVRAGSTHPDFLSLFRGLFEQYGPMYAYPKEAKLTEYEWSVDVDLDSSFDFLLHRDAVMFEQIMANRELFLSYLAGFFDAEGSIYCHRKGTGGAFELNITNLDKTLLDALCGAIRGLGYHAKLSINARDNQKSVVQGADHIWRIEVWRHQDVIRLLQALPLRHAEKVAKKEIALRLPERPPRALRLRILSEWEDLLTKISKDVENSISEAKRLMDNKASIRSLAIPEKSDSSHLG